MELTKMAPRCGVEVSGVSLADCSDGEMDAIRAAIYEHGVAVFRDHSRLKITSSLAAAGAGSM